MRRVAALGVLVAAALTSCASPSDVAPSLTALPAGVTVDVYQTRTDLPARKLEIAITNASEADLTITAAAFESPQFAAPAVWTPRPGGTLVHRGAGVDLPVQLPEPACTDPEPVGVVRLGFTTADGRAGSVLLPVVDRYDRLPDMRAEECFAVAITAIADVRIEDPVRVTDVAGALVGLVPVDIVPRGADSAFTIDGVEDTVLLGLWGPAGAAERLALGLTVAGTDPATAFEIPIVPGRCDPHAIAEDKQGTVFLLEVTAPDGTSGRMRVPAAPAVRASIYDYFAAACGLPG